MLLPRYFLLSGLVTLSAMAAAEPPVPTPQPAVGPVAVTTAPMDVTAHLPPYNHFIPAVLNPYADHAEATGEAGTARVLRARVQRLLGLPEISTTDATKTQPMNSSPNLQAVSKTIAAPVIPAIPTISPDRVPPLWTGSAPSPGKSTPAAATATP